MVPFCACTRGREEATNTCSPWEVVYAHPYEFGTVGRCSEVPFKLPSLLFVYEGTQLSPSKYSSIWHRIISTLPLYSLKQHHSGIIALSHVPDALPTFRFILKTGGNYLRAGARNVLRVSGGVILCLFKFLASSFLLSVTANQTVQKVNSINCERSLSSVLFMGERNPSLGTIT